MPKARLDAICRAIVRGDHRADMAHKYRLKRQDIQNFARRLGLRSPPQKTVVERLSRGRVRQIRDAYLSHMPRAKLLRRFSLSPRTFRALRAREDWPIRLSAPVDTRKVAITRKGLRQGLTFSQIAAKAGMSVSGFGRWMKQAMPEEYREHHYYNRTSAPAAWRRKASKKRPARPLAPLSRFSYQWRCSRCARDYRDVSLKRAPVRCICGSYEFKAF
jgi:hypothetical protein